VTQLERWLTTQALPGARISRARPLTGGYRNDNLLVITTTGARFVLRRYRHGNGCAVEAAIAAMVPAAVPVPEVIAADPDGALAGEPVLLSRFIDGTMMSRVLAAVDPDEAHHLGQVVGRVLGAIGEVTFNLPGFFSGGDLVPQPMDDPGVEAAQRVQRSAFPDHYAKHQGAAEMIVDSILEWQR
jgi:aminoglycoside phosphotransferase (APT) family kinase protein